MADVLICEDDIDLYAVLAASMKALGHTVSLASDPQNILAVLRGKKPDIVVLDMQIPGGGAPRVVKDIEADSALAEIPIIFISGMPLEHLKRWFAEKPNRRYVTKPFNAESLDAVIRELLGRKK